MKRILLSLAAVAALASCVKENNLDPTAGQLTISAVSADSKTLLDGFDVVWEKTDKIAVVVSDGTTAEFSAVESTVNGSEADFVGTVSTDWADATSAYAVYPAAAAGKTHTLPAEQNGEVSGLMLSTAVLDVEDMQKGASKAEFYNALTLLQVVVPEGVQEVKFSADMYSTLVGKVDFSVDAATGAVTFTKTNATRYLTLKAAEGLEAKTYSLLVYPGKVNELTLHMVGLDGAEYTNTVANLEFAAGEYRTIDLCNIFGIYSEVNLYAQPAGGELLVPVVSAVDHEFTVTTEASWITYVETKAFHRSNIVLNVAENTTGELREATVTIAWGEGENESRTYKVSQESALYEHFLNDKDGNPIQWQETFGLYSSETDAMNGTNAVVTYKNVFTIVPSDDPSKGMYKVNGMLVENNTYTGKDGATYYAKYKDGQLVVLKNDNGYCFTDDEVAFTYSETDMTFTAAPIKFGYKFNNADMQNGGYIGGYKAVVKVEEPEVDNGPLDAFVGTWNESFNYVSWNGATPCEGTFEVTVEDGKLLFTGMFNMVQYGTAYKGNYYGELSADGTKVLLSDTSKDGHGMLGPIVDSSYKPTTLEVTVEDGKLVFAKGFNDYVENYVATMQGAVEPEPVDPWASDAVVSVDLHPNASSSRRAMKNVKCVADADFVYVRITASKQLLESTGTEYFGMFMYDTVEGNGDGYSNKDWWMGAAGNNEFEYQGEGGAPIAEDFSFTLVIDETSIDVDATVSDDEIVWEFAIPRTAHANLSASSEKVYMSFLTYKSWTPTGAIPEKYKESMIEVVLP